MSNEANNEALSAKDFNAKLAKLLQGLKRDIGATSVQQNYKGTGSKIYCRQLFVRLNDGALLDLWLEKTHLKFGGVMNRPSYVKWPGVSYENSTPEQVYAAVVEALKGE